MIPIFERMSKAAWEQFSRFCDELRQNQCPVCGYYCNGKGGKGCIDKPSLEEIDNAG